MTRHSPADLQPKHSYMHTQNRVCICSDKMQQSQETTYICTRIHTRMQVSCKRSGRKWQPHTYAHASMHACRSLAKIQAACEQAKVQLSQATNAKISVESAHEGMDLNCAVSRGRFGGLGCVFRFGCFGFVVSVLLFRFCFSVWLFRLCCCLSLIV